MLVSGQVWVKLDIPLSSKVLESPHLVAIFPPSHKQRFGLIHLPLEPQRLEEQIGTKHNPVEPL